MNSLYSIGYIFSKITLLLDFESYFDHVKEAMDKWPHKVLLSGQKLPQLTTQPIYPISKWFKSVKCCRIQPHAHKFFWTSYKIIYQWYYIICVTTVCIHINGFRRGWKWADKWVEANERLNLISNHWWYWNGLTETV